MDTTTAGEAPLPPPPPIATKISPPPFLVKTYDMVDDTSTDEVVSWSSTNNSFVVWDPPKFGKYLLPKHFKHNNFSSFVRQLNTYGFKKVDPDRWEFANERFLRGQKHLLKTISRRRPVRGQSSLTGSCVEVGKIGLKGEVEQLKRDKNVLMQELVELRQQQQSTDNQLQTMVQRLHGMELRQQQMMSFLTKAVNVVQKNESNKYITGGNKKLKVRPDNLSLGSTDGQIIKYQPGETAKEMLRQITSLETFKRVDNFDMSSDSIFSGDMSSSGFSSRTTGTTLQEVSPISSQKLLSITPLQDMGSESDLGLSRQSCLGPEMNNDAIFNSSLKTDQEFQWENPSMGHELEKVPSIGDPFWGQFFASSP